MRSACGLHRPADVPIARSSPPASRASVYEPACSIFPIGVQGLMASPEQACSKGITAALVGAAAAEAFEGRVRQSALVLRIGEAPKTDDAVAWRHPWMRAVRPKP